LPIACGQTISQPYIVAYMSEALEVTEKHRVLEIGTGSGYQAAVLAPLCRMVYTIERHRPLLKAAEGPLQGAQAPQCGDQAWGRPQGLARTGAFRPHHPDGRRARSARGNPRAIEAGRNFDRAGGPGARG
jgi:hypothetical protein